MVYPPECYEPIIRGFSIECKKFFREPLMKLQERSAPISWGKRPTERRSRLIQRFLRLLFRAAAQQLGIFCAEGRKASFVERLADAFGQFVVKTEVVHHGQPHCKHLLGLEQVVDVGAAVAAADRAVAFLVDRTRVERILGVF